MSSIILALYLKCVIAELLLYCRVYFPNGVTSSMRMQAKPSISALSLWQGLARCHGTHSLYPLATQLDYISQHPLQLGVAM